MLSAFLLAVIRGRNLFDYNPHTPLSGYNAVFSAYGSTGNSLLPFYRLQCDCLLYKRVVLLYAWLKYAGDIPVIFLKKRLKYARS